MSAANRATDPTVTTIQRRVAARYGVRVTDIRSDRRARAVTWPRHVAMHLSRELTMHSLPAIGRLFGGRDHSSVMYALRRVEDRITRDQDEAAAIQALADAITADLPRPDADGTNDGRLDRLAALLERRTALKADRDHLDREIAGIDFEIEQLGRQAWGAEGVAPEAREEQAPEPVAPVTLPSPVAAKPAAPPPPEPEPEAREEQAPEPVAPIGERELAPPAPEAEPEDPPAPEPELADLPEPEPADLPALEPEPALARTADCQWIDGDPGQPGLSAKCGKSCAPAHFATPPQPPSRRRRAQR